MRNSQQTDKKQNNKAELEMFDDQGNDQDGMIRLVSSKPGS